MMTRMNLTARERELIEAFRTERNIYNGALSDALAAIEPLLPYDGSLHPAMRAILALRKED